MSPPEEIPGIRWRRHALWACIAALYAALIFTLSEIPGSRLDEIGLHPTLANLCHIPLYAGFAGFVLMAFAGDLAAVRRGPWPTLYTIAAVMTYAISDEYHQRFVPGRFSSAGDLALDFLGASLAIVVMHLAARRGRGPGRGALARREGAASPGLVLALGVAMITFAVYLPALGNGFTNWDDQAYVIENPLVQAVSASNVKRWWTGSFLGNYAPLTLASYAFDHAIWGLRPFGYHLTNVLLHALTAGALVLLLLEMQFPAPAAALAAAIFALHPAQVESVAWISQRKSVLAVFFLLLSFLAYVRGTRASPPSRGALVLSFVLFLAALLSKVTVVIFPGVLFLYDLGFRRERPWRLLVGKIPFLAAALVVAWAGYRLQVGFDVTTPGWMGGSPRLHAATTAGLFARYARILLFPTNLTAAYDPPVAQSVIDPWALAGYAFFALGGWGAWRAFRLNRRALWWMGAFWLGFLPVSQIVTYVVHIAERYLHVPSLGFAAGAGAGFAALHARARRAGRGGQVTAAAGIALACLAALTWARVQVWRDPMTLWSTTVRRPPVHWAADYNYARTLADQGDLRGAIPYYERALTKTDSIEVVTNLGNAYARVGELERAEALLRRAAELPGGLPEKRAQAAANLGVILEARGRFDAAMAAYRSAIALAPRDPVPRVLLGKSLWAQGRATDARLRFEQALERDPGNAGAEMGLARLDAAAGRLDAARKRLDAVIARAPNLPEALLERARVHAGQGDAAAARADLDRALDLAPPGDLRNRIVETRDRLGETGRGR